MPEITPPELRTARLFMTWPNPSQIDEYHSPIIGTTMFDTIIWDGPSKVQDLHDWWSVNRSLDPSDHHLHLNVAIIEAASNRYIGGVSLRPVDGDPAIIDIGYALAPAFHGKGYATEAVGALVEEAFARRGAERIFGNAFVGNHSSVAIAEPPINLPLHR